MVGYNNKRKYTVEIGFLKNEWQTMMICVWKGKSQSQVILN